MTKRSDTKTRILRFFWRLIPWLIVGLILAFVVTMAGRLKEKKAELAESKKKAIKKEIEPVRVITLTLVPRRQVDKINLPGVVEPYENLWVKAEVSGQIVKVLVKEGQRVKKGQMMVQLDDRDYRTRLARIKANYRLAEQDHERIAALARKKYTSTAQLDNIEARLKELTAQLSEAELALSRTKITAPIRGWLNEVKAKKGDLMDENQAVAQILQFDRVKVTVGVPESDVSAVFDLKRAEVIIEALNGLRVKGRTVFLSRQPRTLARLYDLEMVVPNPKGRILPGMFARVELVKQVFDKALTIPLYAVITKGDERFVFVEKDNNAKRRVIELGILVGWQVPVQSGLKPGDRVIVVGHRLLDDGQRVEVIKSVNNPMEILEP